MNLPEVAGTAASSGIDASENPKAPASMAGDALASNSFNTWTDAYYEAVENATPDDYRKTRERAEQGDAEAAFWLHWYFDICIHQPRTDWQLERTLAEIRESIEDYEGAMREAMAAEADRVVHGYRLCSILDPEFDARVASLEWLQVAADLGHHGALRLYHRQARMLLGAMSSNLGFREPGRIAEFKARSIDYAQALMETGHPQAYLLAAEMYFSGAAYPRDYVKSYAYALAANAFDAMESDTEITRNQARRHLSPSQVREAERLADEILERE